MPLHTIPLCNFKYARDVYSSANFKYDTTEEIRKEETKLIYRNTLVDIDKNGETKFLYTNLGDTLNKESRKYLYCENYIINKEKNVFLNGEQSIGFNKNKYVELNKSEDIDINMAADMEFEDTRDIDINIEIDKSISNVENNELNKSSSLIMDKGNLQLYKSESINANKITEKEILENRLVRNFKLEKNICLEKHSINYLDRIRFRYLDVSKLELIKKHGVKNIDKSKHNLVNKINLKNINIEDNSIRVKRNITKNTIKNISPIGLNRINVKQADKMYKNILMYRTILKKIDKYKYTDELNRIQIKNIWINADKKYFYRLALKHIDKGYEKYLDRDVLICIFNDYEKYLNYLPLVNIYKQIDKDLLDLNIWNIYKEHNKSLNGTLINEIYKQYGSNSIEVTKRWWWLKATAPTDKLIIPNKDYIYNRNLLNNANYEYLRFNNNHPIEWGLGSGIDYNVPPMPVSIEIMVDLLNILIMIWHKNTQAWLSCTGKESMQFIMELVYDWYTLSTSHPNADYYRAYRWIRWEAEKVYFLDTKNGLQAIGILIANLIDYLKQHHFNLVPLWKNPKAMDVERNFNRVAANGDIMKDLDKLKGQRHYMIETQNFEKKNILGGV